MMGMDEGKFRIPPIYESLRPEGHLDSGRKLD